MMDGSHHHSPIHQEEFAVYGDVNHPKDLNSIPMGELKANSAADQARYGQWSRRIPEVQGGIVWSTSIEPVNSASMRAPRFLRCI